MAELEKNQPRWGSEGRDRKAAAIRATLQQVCGTGIDAGNWIDVGCGSAGIAIALSHHATKVTGIDPEPWPGWADAMSAHPNLTLLVGGFDGKEIPIPAASVDVAVCNQVYEHVANPAQLVRNLFRVMSPGGTCYFAGPNLLWPVEPHVFWPFVHWLPRGFAKACMRALGSKRADELDAYSAHFITLRRWFREAGFEARPAIRERIVVELRGRGFPRLGNALAKSPNWLAALLEPLAPGMVYVLRKPGQGGVADV